MPQVTAYRRTARLIDHAAPPTPQEWLETDARYFEDIEAEIRRRAQGGDPREAPWASPLYFDTAAREGFTAGRALLVLRHLPAGAVARLVVLGRMLHGEGSRPEAAPAREHDEGRERGTHDSGVPARGSRREGTVGPPVRGGRTYAPPLEGAEALAG
ncbi:hypothetical protein [Streptomyces sp. NPDC002588]|uniref:hypothetical protein n=1 Tax=Streptomyces sp. NPDC002588 TaxID=3154419 RepID=UPI0033214197